MTLPKSLSLCSLILYREPWMYSLRSYTTSCITMEEKWKTALPYEQIPGPKPLPILGNRWRGIPVIGNFNVHNLDVACKNLNNYYGPIVKIVKFLSGIDTVIIFNPDDIECLLKNEDLPNRPVMQSSHYYKTVLKKDFFGEDGGVISTDVESWSRFRKKVQKAMLQPSVSELYLKEIEEAATAFVDRIEYIKDENSEVPENFMYEINKWALESIANVSLDTRLGCLDPNPPKDVLILLDALRTLMTATSTLELKIPFWKLFNTPTWNRFVNALDVFRSTIVSRVDRAIENGISNTPKDQRSVLQRLLASNPNDPKIAAIMVFDMFLVGIDTTSYTVASLLYFLSKYPEKQQRIHDEIHKVFPTEDCSPTLKDFEQMQYLKAAIKETLRLKSPLIGNAREVSKDIVLAGYRIPKGKHVMFATCIPSTSDKYYPNGDKFIPERWLKLNSEFSNTGNEEVQHFEVNSRGLPVFHAFSTIPFGFGKRMCLGKRIANLEMQMVVYKIIRKYKVEFNHGDVGFITSPLLFLNGPLKFKFTRR